jgi:hypothetical protein
MGGLGYVTHKPQNETGTTHEQKTTYLGFQKANLVGTKSALMAWDAAQMNLAVLGTLNGLGEMFQDGG